MKLTFLHGLIPSLFVAAPLMAQMAPQPMPQIETTSGNMALEWLGVSDRTYFVQYSTDLTNWHYFPIIESGTSAALSYGFSTTAEKFFLRLHYTDTPTSAPNSDDFDGDGISNWDEIRLGGANTDPLAWDTDGDGESDYFNDQDNNNLADGWELKHFSAIGTADPSADIDGDGLDNSQESWLDTNPNAHADDNDEDQDGLVDALDAVPDDDLINWPRISKPRYIYVELADLANMEEITPIALSSAGHVLVKAWPSGSQHNTSTMLNFVWQPNLNAWSGPLSKSYNGLQGIYVTATDILSDGSVVGKARVEADTEDSSGNSSTAQYFAKITWSNTAVDPYPASGDRFATSSNSYIPLADIIEPRVTPDGDVLSMDRGFYSTYNAGNLVQMDPSFVSLDGNILDKWFLQGSDPPESYAIYNSFGHPGTNNMVSATRYEGVYDKENEEIIYQENGVYLYQNGVRETVDTTTWRSAIATAQAPDENGVAGTGRILVTGSHTWVKKGNAWYTTKRRISGEKITSSGIILTNSNNVAHDLWLNGEYYTMGELCPSLEEKGYQFYSAVDINDNTLILCQAVDANGRNRVGVMMPISFIEFESNAGFDNYERHHKENQLTVPWLTVPEQNKVTMLYDPITAKVPLSVEFPNGKIGSVDPALTQGSFETLTIASNGPWAADEYDYTGKLKAHGVNALNLAVYKKRVLKVAIHKVTLINDDVDSPIKHGEGKPNALCVRRGTSPIYATPLGDDLANPDGSINTGPNGICETTALNNDIQVIPVGQGEPNYTIIQPGPNNVLNTAVNDVGRSGPSAGDPGNDDLIVGNVINTGANGIRNTMKVEAQISSNNVPNQALIKSELDRIFGKQANIFFTVTSYNTPLVAYDTFSPGGPHVVDDLPNYIFDFHSVDGNGTSAEEDVLFASSFDQQADLNIYYIPTQIRQLFEFNGIARSGTALGFAPRSTGSGSKVVYISSMHSTMPEQYLAGIAAHEIAHHRLFPGGTGLGHPRSKSGNHYVPNSKTDYPLKNLQDDKKRLMFPYSQINTNNYPGLLLKEECDKLRGVWVQPN